MTTIAELAEILKEVVEHGREVEYRGLPRNGVVKKWLAKPGDKYWHLSLYEYRLKPRVTYYRVYRRHGVLGVTESGKKFTEINKAEAPPRTLIKDFEVEE